MEQCPIGKLGMDELIIQVVLPVALIEVFDEIAPIFSASTGYRFETAVMLNPEVPAHVANGAPWSIAFSNPPYIQSVIDMGLCDGVMRDLGYAPLAFAMRGETNDPPLQDRDGIIALLHAAQSIAITKAGTSGAHFRALAAQLGITDQISERVLQLAGGEPLAKLQAGEVAIAALPLTNIASVAGVFARGICPRNMDVHIDLAFCVHQDANAATQNFARWLMDPVLQPRLQQLGIHPL